MFFERPPSSSSSLTTRLCSGHQRTHILRGRIAAILSLSLSLSLKFSCSRSCTINILFECTADGMKERSRACPGEAEKKAAALARQVHSMTSTAKFFSISASGCPACQVIHASSDVTAVPAAERATPRRVSPITLLPRCSCLYVTH